MNSKEYGQCSICGNKKHNKFLIARELLHQTMDEFDYFECENCGCVQIANAPENIQKYYPNDYYSFQKPNEKKSAIRYSLVKQIVKYRMGSINPLGYFFYHLFYNKKPYSWITKGILKFDYKILDIGCGNGELIERMSHLGFKYLNGVDPFIDKDIIYSQNVVVKKQSVFNIEGLYDCIMLHHSLEHMDDQFSVLKKVFKLLHHDRYAIIRIPVCSSRNWRKYGTFYAWFSVWFK